MQKCVLRRKLRGAGGASAHATSLRETSNGAEVVVVGPPRRPVEPRQSSGVYVGLNLYCASRDNRRVDRRKREKERERERGEEKDLTRARGNTCGDSHTWVLFLALRNENASRKAGGGTRVPVESSSTRTCFSTVFVKSSRREPAYPRHPVRANVTHVYTSEHATRNTWERHQSVCGGYSQTFVARDVVCLRGAVAPRPLSLSLSSLSSRPCFLHSGGKLRSRREYDIAPFTVRISLRTPKKCFMFWPHDSVEGVYLPRKKKKENKISIVSRISHFA